MSNQQRGRSVKDVATPLLRWVLFVTGGWRSGGLEFDRWVGLISATVIEGSGPLHVTVRMLMLASSGGLEQQICIRTPAGRGLLAAFGHLHVMADSMLERSTL